MSPPAAAAARTAQRRYTGHPDDPSACLVCGRHRDRHRAADDRCPHTADSLRADQVLGWWRTGGRGGSFLDALDASPELRARVRAAALYYPEPTRARADEARTLIADVLNATDARTASRARLLAERSAETARTNATLPGQTTMHVPQQEPRPKPTRELLAPHDREITDELVRRRRHPELGGSP